MFNWSRPLRLAQHIMRANLGRDDLPYKLTFAVTNRCNARCQACLIWQRNTGHDLSLVEIESFFKQANHFSWIDLTGGEPFVRPDIIPLVTIILRHSPRLYHLHLPTNAVSPSLTIQRIQEILTLAPHKLTITLSLDGPPAQHDTLRGVEGNWLSCLEVYRHFAKKPHPNLEIFFGFTLSDFNLGTFTATMQAVREQIPEVDHRQWHMNIAHRSHYYGNMAIELHSDANQAALAKEVADFRAAKQGWLDPVAFLEGLYLTNALKYLETGTTPLPCLAIRSSLFLTPNGDCLPCSIWNRPLGNIREFDCNLKALLAADRAREAVRDIQAKQCPHCWTPCDAYPTILGNLFHVIFGSRRG
ncbi:MAG: radical SAM protein [Magnetococcus sp. YQC-5]